MGAGGFHRIMSESPGYWFAPTVLAPVAPNERAASEEIFGPVVVVIPFDDEADAVRLANDTPTDCRVRCGPATSRPCGWPGPSRPEPSRSTRTRRPIFDALWGAKASGIGRELARRLASFSDVKNVFISSE